MASLYICYQSIRDPLSQTQVVAYLEGLCAAGYRVVLLTFEPQPLSRDAHAEIEQQLAGKGITWTWLRYHKRPTVPATAWDIFMGVLFGWRLIRQHKLRLVHARSHVAGVMALALKRLTGVRLLFDLRGLMAEEYADAGVWPEDGWLYRATKRMERRLVRAADGIVVLTERARALLFDWYRDEVRGKPLETIPCCVDLRSQSGVDQPASSGEKDATFVYVGKLGGWYLTEQMAQFMTASVRMLPAARWQVWTQSDARPLKQLLQQQGIEEYVAIGQIGADQLPARLRRAHAGLSFIKPCSSKAASSPTKVGEYLAAGLPVIANSGIGDLDQLLCGEEGAVGVLVEPFDTQRLEQGVRRIVELMNDPQTAERCRRTARKHLDLVNVGWDRYRRMYAALLGEARQG
jgi:glycosyltransferase involved in cell wall biosynthesis